MEKLTLGMKISKVQQNLNVIKDQFNSFGKYNYRTLEAILEALKPLLGEQGLVLTVSDQIVNGFNQEKEGYSIPIPIIQAVAKVADVDNIHDFVTCTAYAGVDINKKGMDISQSFGASSTYARKYALCGLFAIDDNKDFDNEDLNEYKSSNVGTGKKDIDPISDKQINYANSYFKKLTLDFHKKKYLFAGEKDDQIKFLEHHFKKNQIQTLNKDEGGMLINILKERSAITTKFYNNKYYLEDLNIITKEAISEEWNIYLSLDQLKKVNDRIEFLLKQM
jgi:hypothetical protein